MKSDLSAKFAQQIRTSINPAPVPEYRFHPVRKWRFDYAWPEYKVAVEIEGGTWVGGRHVRPAGFNTDCHKYNEAISLGWKVIRGDAKMVKDGSLLDYLTKTLGSHDPPF